MQDAILHVIDNFDFRKVHEVMTRLEWKWYSPGLEKVEVPTIDRLQVVAIHLLTQSKKHGSAFSGGFEATFDEKTDVFTLKFVLAHSNSEILRLGSGTAGPPP